MVMAVLARDCRKRFSCAKTVGEQEKSRAHGRAWGDTKMEVSEV